MNEIKTSEECRLYAVAGACDAIASLCPGEGCNGSCITFAHAVNAAAYLAVLVDALGISLESALAMVRDMLATVESAKVELYASKLATSQGKPSLP